MYLDAIFYFVVLMAIFAISDIISTATKAVIPSRPTRPSLICFYWREKKRRDYFSGPTTDSTV